MTIIQIQDKITSTREKMGELPSPLYSPGYPKLQQELEKYLSMLDGMLIDSNTE